MAKHEEMRAKTKTAIRAAFWQLYKQKEIGRITVREVIALSGVNRTTFYRYYADVYQILEQTEQELLQKAERLSVSSAVSQSDMDVFLQNAYALYQEDREYLHELVHQRRDSFFALKYQQALQNKMPVIFMRDGSPIRDEDLETSLELYNYGIVDIFLKWADDGSLSFEKLLELLRGISLEGMYPMLLRVYNIKPIFAAKSENDMQSR